MLQQHLGQAQQYAQTAEGTPGVDADEAVAAIAILTISFRHDEVM